MEIRENSTIIEKDLEMLRKKLEKDNKKTKKFTPEIMQIK